MDAMMVLFGAPESMEPATGALRGVQMALAMQNRLDELNEEWLGRGFGWVGKRRGEKRIILAG